MSPLASAASVAAALALLAWAWLAVRRMRADAGAPSGPAPGAPATWPGLLAHLAAGLILLALCWRLPLADVARTLSTAGPGVFLSYALQILEVFVATCTFSILSGWRAPVLPLVAIHLVSNSICALVPVWYSSEPYRIVRFARWMPLADAGRFSITEQLVDPTVALLFNGIVALGALALHPLAPEYQVPILIAAGVQALIALALAAGALSSVPGHLVTLVLTRLRLLEAAVQAERLPPATLLKAMAVKMTGGFVVLAEYWILLRALGVTLDPGQLLALCAMHWVAVTVFFMIPQRIGVSEGALALGFVALGYPAYLGLSFGLLLRGGQVVWTLVGLLLYGFTPATERVPV